MGGSTDAFPEDLSSPGSGQLHSVRPTEAVLHLLEASPFEEDEDPVTVCDHFNSLHCRLRGRSRRQLNHYEVGRMVEEWRRVRRSIGEPLHVWLGWTLEELDVWERFGKLPES